MVKVFIYKDIDLLEELQKIWNINSMNGSDKDLEIKKLMAIIEQSVEVMIKENDITR